MYNFLDVQMRFNFLFLIKFFKFAEGNLCESLLHVGLMLVLVWNRNKKNKPEYRFDCLSH